MIGGVILVLMDALYNNKKGMPFDIPFCCLTWIRTKTNRTKTCCATITP